MRKLIPFSVRPYVIRLVIDIGDTKLNEVYHDATKVSYILK